MKRLNFGCGSVQPSDWDNYDINPEFHAQRPHWMRAGYYDYVVAHHVLQQWTHHELPAQLDRLRGMLNPGGVLRVSVPDVVAGFDAFLAGDDAWFPVLQGVESISELFSKWLTWYGENHTCFSAEYLQQVLLQAGYVGVRQQRCGRSGYLISFPGICDLDTRCDESIYMEAGNP